MRKNILLTLTTIVFVTSCGARKVKKDKSLEHKTTTTDSTFSNVKSVVTLSDFFKNKSLNTLNDIVSWTYEAPLISSDEVKPFWVRVGRDSLDVSGLPKGGKITVMKDESSRNIYETVVGSTVKEVSDSTSISVDKKLNERKELSSTDIKRESTNWVLAFVAFLFGWLIIPIIKYIYKYFKI